MTHLIDLDFIKNNNDVATYKQLFLKFSVWKWID